LASVSLARDDAGESLLGDGEGLGDGDAGRPASSLPDRDRHGIGERSTVSPPVAAGS
jgi:hypothetical protein